MRTCGTCAACCKWPQIPELSKPAMVPCSRLRSCGHGCESYEERPTQCVTYKCSWLRGIGAEADRPNRCGVMIDRRRVEGGITLVAHPLRAKAGRSYKARAAIRRAVAEESLPCFIEVFGAPGVACGIAHHKTEAT